METAENVPDNFLNDSGSLFQKDNSAAIPLQLHSTQIPNSNLNPKENHFFILKKEADEGSAEAQLAVGKKYEFEKNYQLAFHYYLLAANQGNSQAQYNLGNFYELGKGVNQDISKAIFYYQQAAAKGFAQALYILARCYEVGKRVEKSFEKAFDLYQQAALQGHKKALYKIAICYEYGFLNIKESWKEALSYYKLAAKQGHLKAIRHLFLLYHYGKKVKESQKEALEYLRLGVKLNDSECQFQLGEYYARGWGSLTRSLVEAFKYYHLASLQGHKKAEKSLFPRILHPAALEVNILSYLEDNDVSTLEKILKSYGNHPIFLERLSLS
ncbi:tetratricopeptide repeat protein [Candidatus Protochlamydia amoebophila]|uniref:Uncharacterized protein YbeQ n=1 Tax=Candidatus Protochlamydia amoebophila TaxID=362787 RepID=A0A0C1JKA2_9BACT|nr:tetratricopeptide repeat protein [Candidatus Protochlamydia amoebophila]KIC71031.1 Uncharacterized protein YbeQ [Candidatus Protochlamydia amoebophila]